MNRYEELMKYISLLRGLHVEGLKVNNELNQALRELHNIMFKNDQKPTLIIILEKDNIGVFKSLKTFENIITNVKTVKIGNSENYEIRNENTSVLIYKVDLKTEERVRGLRPSYVINNTGNENIVEKLGLKTV